MKTRHVMTMLTAALVGSGSLCAQDAGKVEPEFRHSRRHQEERNEFPGRRHGRGPEWIERFREENPEEFNRLMEVRRQNPDKFRQEIRERMKDRLRERGDRVGNEEERELRELAKAYHTAESEAEKAELKAEIKEVIYAVFDERMERATDRLERMEQELDRLRDRLEKRRRNREEICLERVEELTRDPALKWQPGWQERRRRK